jgi:hypothetical protein
MYIAARVTRDRCSDFLNILGENIGILTQNKAKLSKTLIITLVLENNANFSAKNCQKSQKIVIITSTPDRANIRPMGECLILTVFRKLLKKLVFFCLLF